LFHQSVVIITALVKSESDFVSLGALADNGRLQKMNGVISAFSTLMSAHRGEVVCTVTTAKVSPVQCAKGNILICESF